MTDISNDPRFLDEDATIVDIPEFAYNVLAIVGESFFNLLAQGFQHVQLFPKEVAAAVRSFFENQEGVEMTHTTQALVALLEAVHQDVIEDPFGLSEEILQMAMEARGPAPAFVRFSDDGMPQPVVSKDDLTEEEIAYLESQQFLRDTGEVMGNADSIIS